MKTKQDPSQNNKIIIHEKSRCSKCGKSPIEGIRFLCLNCSFYELCSSCEKKYGENHGHPLLKIRNPTEFNKFKHYINQKEPAQLDTTNVEKKTINLSKCYSKCMNLKKQYITRNNNNFIPIEIILKNTGEEQWPTPCFLTCDENSDVKGERIKLIKCDGKPGEEYKLKLKINLEKIKKTGIYKSIWQLKNERDEKFGDKFVFIINDIFNKDLNINKDENKKKIKEIKDYRGDYQGRRSR